ncbi:MAG: PepSY domain-containing protein [Methanofollis sp.]|nr:PepSY domain-containing protein [Methanofollis sp.]
MYKKLFGSFLIILAVFIIFIWFFSPGQADPVQQGPSPSPSPTPPETTRSATTIAAEITEEEAKAIAVDAFPEIVGPDTAKVRFEQINDALGERRSWEVDDYSADLNVEGARHAQVWVDAATGEIMELSIPVKRGDLTIPSSARKKHVHMPMNSFREERRVLSLNGGPMYPT